MSRAIRPVFAEPGDAARLPAPVQPQSPGYPSQSLGMMMTAESAGGEDLLKEVWRRRGLVLVLVVLAVGAAAAYLWRATPVYTVTARLYLQERDPVSIGDPGRTARTRNYLFTQCEVIRATPILAEALRAVPTDALATLPADHPVEHLKNSLMVDVGKKDDLIDVNLDSPDPAAAALIVNAVVQSYVDNQSRQKKSTATEVLRVLEKEKETREAELRAKRAEMMRFKAENGTLSFENDKGNLVIQRLAQLSDALTLAQLDAFNAKATYDSARALADDPEALRRLLTTRNNGEIRQDPAVAQLEQEINQLEVRRAVAERQLSGNHSYVQGAKLALDRLQERLQEKNAQVANAYIAALEQEWKSAKQKEQDVQAALLEEQRRALDWNVKATSFATMQADVTRLEKLADALEARIKEASVQRDAGALDISVVENATVPSGPSKPRKFAVLGLATVVGLLLGVGASLARAWMDQRFHSGEDVLTRLGMPVLCSVPHIRGGGGLQRRGQIVLLEPLSDVAEAYRTVRTAVRYNLRRAGVKSLLVTSPERGDGKSTMASNLAIAMAQAGERTLLIDADLRLPSQDTIMRADNGTGLSMVLSGRSPVEDAIVTTSVEGLHLLPSGPVAHNPSELLSSRAFADVLRELSRRYDRIIVDSPPVASLADARILAGLCDRTLLVLRANKSTRRAGEEACGGLLDVGAEILGIVVNDVPASETYYGYQYRRNGHAQPQLSVLRPPASPGEYGAGERVNGRPPEEVAQGRA